MSVKLDDGRLLMARLDDIKDFFDEHQIVGRTIADIRGEDFDYIIKDIEDLDENLMVDCGITTDGFVSIVFEDGDNIEVFYSGDGPVVLGFNTANFDEYAKEDGSCYPLRTMFKKCIGKKIVGIHAERTDYKMAFPCYMGIDMSEEDEGVDKIGIKLEDGMILEASGWLDFFDLSLYEEDGNDATIELLELLKEIKK